MEVTYGKCKKTKKEAIFLMQKVNNLLKNGAL